MRKPLAPIYELATQRLGVPAHRVLFVDDTDIHVRGARRTGLLALTHVNTGTTWAAIAQVVPALNHKGVSA